MTSPFRMGACTLSGLSTVTTIELCSTLSGSMTLTLSLAASSSSSF